MNILSRTSVSSALLPVLTACVFFAGCASSRKSITGINEQDPPFTGTVLENAHTGIFIFDPESGDTLYNYNAAKYFVPASNMKLFTLYTALNILKDQVPGLEYVESADTLYLFPTGDPSFLHRDFTEQPVFKFLKEQEKPMAMVNSIWNEKHFGPGWAWSDYGNHYMPERSPFPIYGNLIHWVQLRSPVENSFSGDSLETFIFSEPDVNWKVNFRYAPSNATFGVTRGVHENHFFLSEGKETEASADVPFITDTLRSALELLEDSLGKDISITNTLPIEYLNTLYSRPLDSLLIPMMHRSDNFFAEQLLLSCAYMTTGYFNNRSIIDSMLNGPLAGMPDPPRWVDGSGLSRYNLVTPRSMVWLLDTLRKETGMERLRTILPTGGEGTLQSYYTERAGKFFAKTGTLSNQVALSGYLYSKKEKLLLFSVLVNNHTGSAADVREQVENFLSQW